MIRPAEPDDLRFVRSSWLKSYASSDFAKLLTPTLVWAMGEAAHEYFDAQRVVIDACLARSAVLVDDDGGMIDGWLACEPGVVHYVYVRQSARGRGVARSLMTRAGFDRGKDAEYTHRSRTLNVSKVPRGWRYSFWRLLGTPSGKAA